MEPGTGALSLNKASSSLSFLPLARKETAAVSPLPQVGRCANNNENQCEPKGY
jgi:hypothetical protein